VTKKGSLDMAEGSQLSTRKGRRNTSKIEKSITPEEASEILASALFYCRQAGLKTTGYNQGNALIVCISGLNLVGGTIQAVGGTTSKNVPPTEQATAENVPPTSTDVPPTKRDVPPTRSDAK
jgi:hypothetical protein